MDSSRSLLIAVLLATSCALHFVPLYTRPDIFFGVTIVPAFRRTDAARRVLHNCRALLWSITVLCVGVSIVVRQVFFPLIGYCVGVCAAFTFAHRQATAHRANPVSVVEVDLSSPAEQLPGGLTATFLPFVLLGCIGYLAVKYAAAPTFQTVMRIGIAEFSCLVLTAVGVGVLRGSRRIVAAGPAVAGERSFRGSVLLGLIACEYFMVLLASLDVLRAPRQLVLYTQAAVAAALVYYLISLFRLGQGGTRTLPVSDTIIGDRTPDTCWKGGLVYFNRSDPAFFVEKRMGIGYTLNFGNRWTWVFLAAILTAPWALRTALPVTTTARAASTVASPGTEESLRRYIESLEDGHPNYSEMAPALASAVEQQLPAILAVIRKLGKLKALAYEGVDPSGLDIYEAAFDNGRLEWHLAPLSADGKAVRRSFRRLP